MDRAAVRALILLGAITAGASAVHAQAVPQIRLKPANAKLDAEFTRVAGVRELSDGRVLITDAGENKLVIADFSTSSVTQVARQGRGPGEYVLVRDLLPLRGDTTAMLNLRAWLLFAGATPAGQRPADDPAVRAARVEVFGSDSLGFVYASAPQPRRDGATGSDIRDSSRVIRVSISTARVDTIAHLRVRPTELKSQRLPSGMVATRLMPPAFSAAEEAAAARDGWVAIARLEPYRVDWVDPSGRLMRSAPLPVTLPRVTTADREPLLAVARKNRPERMLPYDTTTFPEVMPAFQNPALVTSPDGRALVHRTAMASAPGTRYDVVDRRGALVGTIALPKSERIAGFGPKSIYIVAKDADDIEHLRRHPWP